jgi:hypothetical protein
MTAQYLGGIDTGFHREVRRGFWLYVAQDAADRVDLCRRRSNLGQCDAMASSQASSADRVVLAGCSHDVFLDKVAEAVEGANLPGLAPQYRASPTGKHAPEAAFTARIEASQRGRSRLALCSPIPEIARLEGILNQ